MPFRREQIDQMYNLQEMKNGSKFKRLVETPDYQKIVDLLTDGNGKWNATKKSHTSLSPEQQRCGFIFYVQSRHLPNIYALSGRRRQSYYMPYSKAINLVWEI